MNKFESGFFTDWDYFQQVISRVNHCFVMLVFAAVFGIINIQANAATPAPNPMVVKCQEDLAQRYKLEVKDITLIEALPTVWPDAALGMPEIDHVYAQVQTPGWKITLEAKNTRYLYTASDVTFRFGGPVTLWSSSMLYLQQKPGDPNLNSDLYQCSLAGTNNVLLASEVSDFYPQQKGAIIIKQRTSRSSHELIMLKADDTAKISKLYAAFDFGEVTLNDTQDTWAGFVRPMLGNPWTVVVARIGQDSATAQLLPLPDGVKPGKIAWSGKDLLILNTIGIGSASYSITPSEDTPAWKAINSYSFPSFNDMVLSKSETLEVEQIKVKPGEKPSVEVARIWFTGERTVKVKIDGLTLKGYELFSGYLFLWGEQHNQQVACSVNINNGEVTYCYHGVCQQIKLFHFPPLTKI